ncbi:MAG: hypothetical protein ACTHK8_13265 [Ginsengibacter sp.]
MKNLLFICLLFSQNSFCQNKSLYSGFASGYNLKGWAQGEINVGLQIGKPSIEIAGDVPLTRSSEAPGSVAMRLGFKIGSFKPFFEGVYKSIGMEEEAYFKDTNIPFRNGFRLGGGVTYYNNKIPIFISAERSGKDDILIAGALINFSDN